MCRPCEPAQRHAIFTVTKKFPLGTPAALRIVTTVPMTASFKHHRSNAGTSLTKAQQQRCVAMRPVVTSTWNKQPGPGLNY
jgi:hypothetical protein